MVRVHEELRTGGVNRSMRTLKRMRHTPLLFALVLVAMMAVPTMSVAAQPPVDLGTTSGFAVLAGGTITNTGPTTITGDVGLSPGSAFVDTGVTLNLSLIHISEPTRLGMISYAVFCLKKKKK